MDGINFEVILITKSWSYFKIVLKYLYLLRDNVEE